MKKIFLLLMIVFCVAAIALMGVGCTEEIIEEEPIEETPDEDAPAEEEVPTEEKVQSTKELVEKIILYESGKQEVVDIKSEDGIRMASLLTRKLHELNLQSTCVFIEEDIIKIKEKDRIVELVFKNPADITISQWVEQEERYHIPVDEKGYRILEDVETSLFILEDTQDRGLEAHILVGHEVEGRIVYSCWAVNISQEGKPQLDRTWIVNRINLSKDIVFKDQEANQAAILFLLSWLF